MAGRHALNIADLDSAAHGGTWLPRQFWRYAAWGTAATLASALAMVALASEQGSQRLAEGWRVRTGEAADAVSGPLAGRVGNAELDTRRLNDLVRQLTADRDRIMTRMTSLERNLDEMSGTTITGSISSGAPTRGSFMPTPPAGVGRVADGHAATVAPAPRTPASAGASLASMWEATPRSMVYASCGRRCAATMERCSRVYAR